mgnify:CR=1 FL=1
MENLLEIFNGWLDPVMLGPMLLGWGGKFVAAVFIVVVGRWVAKALIAWSGKAVRKAEVDSTLIRFLSSIAYVTLMIIVVISALGALGVPITSFLAIIGAASLAVGLALKDSLENFAAGVMLVLFRPFKVGDFIDTAGISGSVESIRIFNTVVKTPDNRVITVPNGLIYADTITNYSAEERRRIDLVIGISYDDDIGRDKALIQGVLMQESRLLKEPPATVLLLELGESSVNFGARPWVRAVDYWSVRGDLLESIKRVIEENGLSIPYPQRDLRIVDQVQAGV